jgi:hypothetical protein
METKLYIAGFDGYTAHQKALGMLYGILQQQATLLAYADNFRLLGCLALLCIPLAFFFRRVRKPSHGNTDMIGE